MSSWNTLWKSVSEFFKCVADNFSIWMYPQSFRLLINDQDLLNPESEAQNGQGDGEEETYQAPRHRDELEDEIEQEYQLIQHQQHS